MTTTVPETTEPAPWAQLWTLINDGVEFNNLLTPRRVEWIRDGIARLYVDDTRRWAIWMDADATGGPLSGHDQFECSRMGWRIYVRGFMPITSEHVAVDTAAFLAPVRGSRTFAVGQTIAADVDLVTDREGFEAHRHGDLWCYDRLPGEHSRAGQVREDELLRFHGPVTEVLPTLAATGGAL